jgi:hypothetical protein
MLISWTSWLTHIVTGLIGKIAKLVGGGDWLTDDIAGLLLLD